MCLAVYLLLNKNKKTTPTPTFLKNIKTKSETPLVNKRVNPYITPKPYNTGYIQEPQSLASGSCGSDVMYPIQHTYVKYDKWKNGGDCCSGSCDNLIFNAPP